MNRKIDAWNFHERSFIKIFRLFRLFRLFRNLLFPSIPLVCALDRALTHAGLAQITNAR